MINQTKTKLVPLVWDKDTSSRLMCYTNLMSSKKILQIRVSSKLGGRSLTIGKIRKGKTILIRVQKKNSLNFVPLKIDLNETNLA